MDRNMIFQMITEERSRQDKIHPIIKTNHESEDLKLMANMLLCNDFLAVLIEEVGEVGSALQGDGNLKEELIQVASVVVRWLENLK